MKHSRMLLSLILLGMFSCGDGSDEYNLTSPLTAKWDVVNEKNNNLELLSSWISNLKFEGKKSSSMPIMVNVRDEVNALFMPKNNPCGTLLPKKLKDKIDSNSYVPEELSSILKSEKIKDTALYFPGGSLSSILHTFKIKNLNEYIEISSYTRDLFNKDEFLIQDKSKFIFTTDCSGYISGVASVALNKKLTGDFKSSLSSSVGKEGAVVIGLATFKSPLLIAIFEDAAPSASYKMPDSTRIKILSNISNRLQTLPDTTQIEIFENYQLLFSSKSTEAKFNGKVELNAKGSINAGVISANAELNASAKISRSTIMDNFNVIVLDAKPYLSILKIDKKLINQKLAQVQKKLSAHAPKI